MSLSALSAFVTQLEVTANNLANSTTTDFKKQRVDFIEASPSGVSVTIRSIDAPGMELPADESNPGVHETSNVVVEEELANLITTRHMYGANLAVIKTEEEMEEHLIDIVT
jgi:flagellar hook protein FlgE